MGDEEAMGYNKIEGGRVSRLKGQAACNGIDVPSANESDDGSSRYPENYRFYKRRKRAMSNSGNKGMEHGIGSAEAPSKSADQTAEDLPSHLFSNHSAPHGTKEASPIQFRSFILKHMYLSLCDEGGGIGECIREAINTKTGCTSNGTPAAVLEETSAKANVLHDDSVIRNNNMCRLSLLKVWQSKDFTSLCKLIFENFQGVNADKLFGLSLIDKRMKDGIYGRSPTLFSADIQQLWLKLQKVGTELMSLAKSLADISMSCYSEQFGGAANCTSEVGKHEFGTRESVSHDKPEQTESCIVSTCRTCSDKADGRNCLVCDACEDMYHLSCIEPALKEIPSKSWFCATCAGARPHVNCSLCVTTNPPSSSFRQPADEMDPTAEEAVSEPEQIVNEKLRKCKICARAVKKGKCMTCEHPFCPNKYCHKWCLTPKQLCRFGPKWYCPSCLCRTCRKDKDDHMVVLCDSCDHAYHIYCVEPPLVSIPEGKWFCHRCNLKIQEIQKAKSAYLKREKMKRKIEDTEMAGDNRAKKPSAKAMDSEKVKDGMSMLAFAALKCEVGSSSYEAPKSM